MKKTLALLLAVLLSGIGCARAESAGNIYDVLSGLMNGREFTLTVEARSDTEALAETIARYGTVVCALRQEDDGIKLSVTCDGDAYLTAAATKTLVRFDTNLTENGAFTSDWAALEPQVTAEEDRISITMTGPDHELIRFGCNVTGTDIGSCSAEIEIGFITGPGNVHSLWDGITNEDGGTGREFYLTFSEEEYSLEGDGTITVETAEDGSLIITREETLMLTYQEDEQGEITFRSTLTIR